ncbi:ABC transporter permease [Chitinophaga sp. RCC_12]|uniref:ABC transporter permease n=1 Tax=Chitinophaga sp. RCC_12 TaxID=3239226 RepID=UPI003526140D
MLLFNYIKLAWRNLAKRKLYSFINIGGLAAGLCACMLIMLYVVHELSYDRFHKDNSRIYSLFEKIRLEKDTMQLERFNATTAASIQQQNAAVESYIRMGNLASESIIMQSVANPNIKSEERDTWFTDANYFSFFSFPLLSGDKNEVLKQPFTAVISASTARKYFGSTDVIGKQLRYNGKYIFQVSGVMADAPSNSSIQANILLSYSSMAGIESMREIISGERGFAGIFFKVFLKLDDPAHAAAVVQNIDRLIAAQLDQGRAVMVPITRIHTDANFSPGFNLRYLKLFPLVAALILLMALINYMSLSTARATVRAREIGVRKSLGADHKSIAKQFYVESALYAFLAFCLALLLCQLLRPWFFNLLQLKVDVSFLYHPVVLMIYVLLLLITILLAGSYPSFVLSRYNPVYILSGKMSRVSGGASVRKVLTVLQFGTAAVLIICSIVINRQLYFFRHAATGINKENVVMLPFQGSMRNHYQAYRQQVAALNGVQQTATARYPLYGGYDMWFVMGEGNRPPMALSMLSMDHSLFGLTGLQWKFPPADSTQLGMPDKIVLNESAVESFGFSGSPLGKYINLGDKKVEVIGVVKNFHYKSLHSAITPLGINVEKDNTALWGANSPGCMFVKVAPKQNMPALMAKIQKIYAAYDMQEPFEYTFLDDAFGRLYTAEDRLAGIFGWFTVLTVLISALGLLGLAAFSAEQRTREIGVRKVLGASVAQITTLLSKEFIRLVVIALVIASPVAWYLMRQWLQQFAFRIDLQPWMFILAAIIAVTTALLAIGLQTVKAAVRNPVNALKIE